MHITRSTRATAALVAAVSLGACRGEARHPEYTRESPVVRGIESPGSLALRREAQDYFEQARVSFLEGNSAAASKALREAEGFFRAQTELAGADAQQALETSATELAFLASEVESGKMKVLASLDHAFARAQIAEAQNHYVRAATMLRKQQREEASAELTMAVDHFERAGRDGSVTLSAGAAKALDQTRNAAAELRVGTPMTIEQLDRVLSSLGREIRAISLKLARKS